MYCLIFYFYKKKKMETLKNIVLNFNVEGNITDVKPLGEGLINDTFKVYVEGFENPKYVLQIGRAHV